MATSQNQVHARHLALVIAGAFIVSGCGVQTPARREPASAATSSSAEALPTAAASPSTTSSDAVEPVTSDEAAGATGRDGGTTCALITDEEAGDLLGVRIVNVRPFEDAKSGMGVCVKGTAPSKDFGRTGSQMQFAVDRGETTAADFDQLAADSPSIALVTVAGSPAAVDASLGVMYAQRGDTLFTVIIGKAGTPGTTEELTTVIELLMERTPA